MYRPGRKRALGFQMGGEAGEEFGNWLDRIGGPKAVAEDLKELDHFPSPDEAPDFYIDYDETGPYSAEVGAGECAGA